LEDEGYAGVVEPGHAALRFSNPTTGGDVMPTLRAEMHRLRPGVRTAPVRQVGSSVWQVFEGEGTVSVGSEDQPVGPGDLIAVPSWTWLSFEAGSGLDLFRFSDAPIFERLHADRRETR
jgi:gentisate 1,2-dioxygenase